MRTFLAAIMLLPLAACATPRVPVAGGGECRNDGLDRFVGRKATAEIGAQVLKTSGAGTLRWGAPGMAMTMDFRADRVTVSYDAAMLITSARCG
jgi:hypothetical protein